MRSLPRPAAFPFVFLTALCTALVFGIGSAQAAATPTVLSVGVPTAGTYILSQNLDFTVNYDQAVTVDTLGGTPSLPITIGATVVQAIYISGSGTSTLTFRRTVTAGDYDTDGIAVGASLNLNGGTIVATSDGTTNASLALSGVGSTAGVLVDGIPPSVSSILRKDPTPTNQAAVDYTITFSEGVSGVDISDFALTATGSATGTVASVTPVSSSVYTVTVNALSGNGTLRLDLRSSGTGITDAAGNAISGGYSSGQLYTLDTVVPTISSVAVPTSGSYKAGQALVFTVNYSENVVVNTTGGTPQLPLRVGTSTVNALYVSGSGTSALVFSYTVKAGDADSDGIVVGSAINTNGGTIQDPAGNTASSTLTAVGSTTGVLVNTAAPVVASVSVPAAGTYTAGQTLYFTVNFSAAVTVSGSPGIALTVGTAAKNAVYISGSGTTALKFAYTPTSGDTDTDGITVGALSLNSGTIQDTAGNDANLTLNSIGSTSQVLVETVAPAVISVTVPKAGSYTQKGALDFTVQFSAPVTVTTAGGTPAIALTIGSTSKNAVYISGSGTDRLVFRYTVSSGDNDTDGIDVGALSLNGGAIKDSGGNAAVLTLKGVGATTGVLIDTTAPTVSSLSAPANGTYLTGQTLSFTATFAEPVTVTGSPRLALTIGSRTAYAVYVSGSGTAKLVFSYTVASGDSDTDGIQLASTLDLNGGSIVDAAGNAISVLTVTAPSLTGVLVGTQPAPAPGTKPGTKPGQPGTTDKTPPSKPAIVKASVRNGHLFVTFSRAKDNTRVAGYEIIIAGKVLKTIKATAFLLPTAAIMPAKAQKLTITVEAVDTAGNAGPPFTVTLTRIAEPKGMPSVVPGWAWRLAAWQAEPARKRGKRPHAPSVLPSWYIPWAAWQMNPLKVSVGS